MGRRKERSGKGGGREKRCWLGRESATIIVGVIGIAIGCGRLTTATCRGSQTVRITGVSLIRATRISSAIRVS